MSTIRNLFSALLGGSSKGEKAELTAKPAAPTNYQHRPRQLHIDQPIEETEDKVRDFDPFENSSPNGDDRYNDMVPINSQHLHSSSGHTPGKGFDEEESLGKKPL